MKIIISPARKMDIRNDIIQPEKVPYFIEKTKELKRYLESLSYQELKEIWKCSDKVAKLNFEKMKNMDLEKNTTPAILAYNGIQYQYMAPYVFEEKQWDYIKKHLNILSGFYGILEPLDGIVPYRLEMQAKISIQIEKKTIHTLYQYWRDCIYMQLIKQNKDNIILNLASQEYSKVIESYLSPNIIYVTCIFGTFETDKNGDKKLKVKATQAKMARGEMIRFLAEHQIQNIEEIKTFNGLGYQYIEALSEKYRLVFAKDKKY